MKRFTVLCLGLLVLAACQDASNPDATAPNVGITTAEATDNYGGSEYFTFFPPIVPSSEYTGTFNPRLRPIVELYGPVDPGIGDAFACSADDEDLTVTGDQIVADGQFTEIAVDSVGERYSFHWDTDKSGMYVDSTYTLCIKVAQGFGAVPEMVGWRNVRPDKSGAPNNTSGLPYLFNNGRSIPVEFWIGNGALCKDILDLPNNEQVIDCTLAIFDSAGGTALCDDGQCGLYFPAGALTGEELVAFRVEYVECNYLQLNSLSNDYTAGDSIVRHLEIDIPQYTGCLRVTTSANFPWEGIFANPNDPTSEGIVAAACRETGVIDDERLLLHVESPYDRSTVYALPTRAFDLDCGGSTSAEAPGEDGSFGDWMKYYASTGARALKSALVPWVDPPELKAGHVGMGGGTSLSCKSTSVAGFEGGPQGITSCTAPALVSGDGPMAVETEPGVEVTFNMVWATPAMMSKRLKVDEFGANPTEWQDPESIGVGGDLYPAVMVTDDCKILGTVTLPDGTVVTEDCGDFTTPTGIPNAVVTFYDQDGDSIGTGVTDDNGIAWAHTGWTIPDVGSYTATASGLGIGINDRDWPIDATEPTVLSLQAYTDDTAEGSYQDHLGNNAVQLLRPALKFNASVCTDLRDLLKEPGIEPEYTDTVRIPINISGSDADAAFLYTASDCYQAYFALEVPAAEELQNSLRVVFVDRLETRFTDEFDPANPMQFAATPVVGDDMWFISRDGNKKSATFGAWQIEDWHVSDDCTGNKQSECGTADDPSDPSGDLTPVAESVVTQLPDGTTVYEFAREFGSGDSLDFYVPDVGGDTWIGFYLVLQMGKGAQGNTEYPDFRVFQPVHIELK